MSKESMWSKRKLTRAKVVGSCLVGKVIKSAIIAPGEFTIKFETGEVLELTSYIDSWWDVDTHVSYKEPRESGE